MDNQFEYLHNKLLVKGFENNVHHFLKGKLFRLKHLFTKKRPIDSPNWHGI